jgi:hypothetical protein
VLASTLQHPVAVLHGTVRSCGTRGARVDWCSFDLVPPVLHTSTNSFALRAISLERKLSTTETLGFCRCIIVAKQPCSYSQKVLLLSACPRVTLYHEGHEFIHFLHRLPGVFSALTKISSHLQQVYTSLPEHQPQSEKARPADAACELFFLAGEITLQ